MSQNYKVFHELFAAYGDTIEEERGYSLTQDIQRHISGMVKNGLTDYSEAYNDIKNWTVSIRLKEGYATKISSYISKDERQMSKAVFYKLECVNGYLTLSSKDDYDKPLKFFTKYYYPFIDSVTFMKTYHLNFYPGLSRVNSYHQYMHKDEPVVLNSNNITYCINEQNVIVSFDNTDAELTLTMNGDAFFNQSIDLCNMSLLYFLDMIFNLNRRETHESYPLCRTKIYVVSLKDGGYRIHTTSTNIMKPVLKDELEVVYKRTIYIHSFHAIYTILHPLLSHCNKGPSYKNKESSFTCSLNEIIDAINKVF